jgi:RimJ/RimL family protein N-acetyltransferase
MGFMNLSRGNSAPCPIRPIEKADAPALMGFYNGLSPASKRNFHPMGTTATLEQCVAVCEDNGSPESDRYDLVGVTEGQVVGWCFLWGLRSDKVSLGLGVADAWQQQGLGAAMMRVVMQHARALQISEIHLTCVEDNAVAQKLYAAFGFERSDHHMGEDGLPYVGMRATLMH